MMAEWLEALPRVRQVVGERNFETWIEPIHCVKDENGFVLQVSSRFFLEWVARHFLPVIRQALTMEGGPAPALRMAIAAAPAPEAAPRSPAPTDKPARSATPRPPKIGHLVADYTFDAFVVGEANEVACRAARSVTEAPGRRFNPLFVWGGVGLGKTHLINALAHELLNRRQRRRVACLAAETFMNSLISALRQHQMDAFRNGFREVDVLILDDVQFLAGKERTQEEFFHTFNALHTAGNQIVLTSDKPPHAIAELEQRLRSRFEGGLIADIHPPTSAMRVAIAKKKAALHGVELPLEVAQLVAQRSGPSVRELEGALTRVLATSALRGVPLDAALVETLLAPLDRNNRLSVEIIQERVSEHFHVSVGDLKSHRRDRAVTYARQIAMYLSRTMAEVSFPSIAEQFGNRDHSTVMHAVRAVEDRRRQDPTIGSVLLTLESELRSRAV